MVESNRPQTIQSTLLQSERFSSHQMKTFVLRILVDMHWLMQLHALLMELKKAGLALCMTGVTG
jgi:hypothetical protein